MDKIKYIKENGKISMIKDCGFVEKEQRAKEVVDEITVKNNLIALLQEEIDALEEEVTEINKL